MAKEKLLIKSLKITPKKEVELQKYANKFHNGNVSEAIRNFIDKGLAIDSYKSELDTIRSIVGEELENKIEPFMKRLIAINVKGSVMSASSHYLNGIVIEKLVPESKRQELKETLAEAYISSKDFKVERIGKDE